jgi:hypothetical protein
VNITSKKKKCTIACSCSGNLTNVLSTIGVNHRKAPEVKNCKTSFSLSFKSYGYKLWSPQFFQHLSQVSEEFFHAENKLRTVKPAVPTKPANLTPKKAVPGGATAGPLAATVQPHSSALW